MAAWIIGYVYTLSQIHPWILVCLCVWHHAVAWYYLHVFTFASIILMRSTCPLFGVLWGQQQNKHCDLDFTPYSFIVITIVETVITVVFVFAFRPDFCMDQFVMRYCQFLLCLWCHGNMVKMLMYDHAELILHDIPIHVMWSNQNRTTNPYTCWRCVTCHNEWMPCQLGCGTAHKLIVSLLAPISKINFVAQAH